MNRIISLFVALDPIVGRRFSTVKGQLADGITNFIRPWIAEMQNPSESAPAANPSKVLLNIIRDCLLEGDASHLALDSVFMNARFRAHQIVQLIEFASVELHIALSVKSVAREFDLSHSAVTRAKLRGYDISPARGRHREFPTNAEQELVDWIAQKAANHTTINRTELLHECVQRFGKSITRGWVNSFLPRHADELFQTKVLLKKIKDLKYRKYFSKRRSMASSTMFTMRDLSLF
jgi:hypothetical protein